MNSTLSKNLVRVKNMNSPLSKNLIVEFEHEHHVKLKMHHIKWFLHQFFVFFFQQNQSDFLLDMVMKHLERTNRREKTVIRCFTKYKIQEIYIHLVRSHFLVGKKEKYWCKNNRPVLEFTFGIPSLPQNYTKNTKTNTYTMYIIQMHRIWSGKIGIWSHFFYWLAVTPACSLP